MSQLRIRKGNYPCPATGSQSASWYSVGCLSCRASTCGMSVAVSLKTTSAGSPPVKGRIAAPASVDGPDVYIDCHGLTTTATSTGMRTLIRISVCVGFAVLLAGCGSSADPTSSTSPSPTPPVVCSSAITIGVFPNGTAASPGQGMVWTSYFQATVLPAQPSVYIVDINASPVGCLPSEPGWTAVSANTSAVQLSPANGTGRSQVELFIPANVGAQRSTLVTIAGQTASITQAGR